MTEKKRHQSGTETRDKTKVMGFRADPIEQAEIENDATREGLTVSSYIRDTVLKRARTGARRKPLADVMLLTRTLAELGKVGSNLNQIARRINEGGSAGINRINSVLDDVLILKEEIISLLRPADDSQGQEQGGGKGPR